MLEIAPATMARFEDEAWGRTARWLAGALPAVAADDPQLDANLSALSQDGYRHLVTESVTVARDAGFEERDDVMALACVFLRYGPQVSRAALGDAELDPAEQVEVTEAMARRAARLDPAPPA